MAGNAITAALIDQMAANDANWLGQMYAQIKRRLIQWQVNCPDGATMTGLGYNNATSQAEILQLQANLNVLMQAIEGTQTAANTHSMLDDLAKLQGVS